MSVRAGPRATSAALLLFGLLLFLPGLGNHDLWNPDEPRYAQVAREMAASGDVLVPRLNGETYMQKPPLFFWAIMAAGAARVRIDETAARLPSALSAAVAIVLTWAIGRRLMSERAAVLGALVFATNSKILWQGRFGQIDMLLTALVALGMYAWVRGYLERDARWYPAFFVATGLATLAKGPVGLLPPLLAILVFLALTRDRVSFRALGLGRGLLLWALIVAAWFVPASLAVGGGYASEVGFHQTLVRYLSPWLHQSPWYHYLEDLPGDFFPWSLLLPTTAVVLWREARVERGVLFAACWVGATLLFFSASPAKRGVYVLTMYPGLALLVGSALDRVAASWPRYRTWVAWALGVLATAAAGAAALLALRPPDWSGAEAVGGAFVHGVAALVAALAVGTAAALALALRGRPGRAFVVEMAALVLVAIVFLVGLLPRLDAISSLRPVAALVEREVPPGVRYGVYPYLQTPLLFYSNHYAEELVTKDDLSAFLGRPGRRWLVMRAGIARELGDRLPAPVAVVGVPYAENWFALFELEGPRPAARRAGE